jgi:hypothetical protein
MGQYLLKELPLFFEEFLLLHLGQKSFLIRRIVIVLFRDLHCVPEKTV